MKTLLICHEGAELDVQGLARWLASFSELVGLIVIQERGQRMRQRIRREIKRVGWLSFVDVLAYRLYYKLVLARGDTRWQERELRRLCEIYPDIPAETPRLYTHSPNSSEAREFVKRCEPDIMIARCKTILKESVFTIPSHGTWVMHPGICPEYRNAHGCFWALANDDLDKVGMTLLKIDAGVDTGPVYGYYTYGYDEVNETHIVIQYRVTTENLDALQSRLEAVMAGEAQPLDVTGRDSGTWGQPWLSRYLRWKRKARGRQR